MADGETLFFTTAGGLAVTDLLLRIAPELLGVGDSVVIPTLLGVTAAYVVESPVAGGIVGSVLLASFAGYLAPRFFPPSFRSVGGWWPLRAVVGVGTLAVTLQVEQLILGTVTDETTWVPVAVTLETAAVLVGGVLLGLGAVQFLGDGREGRPGSTVGRDATTESAGLQLVRGAFLVVVLSVILADLSLLFPLPELFTIGAAAVAVSPVRFDPETDVTERLALGAHMAWASWTLVVTLGYGVFLFSYAVVVATWVFGRFPLAGFLEDGLLGAAFFGCLVIVPALTAVKFVDRSFQTIVGIGRDTSYPVGFAVPAGLLVGVLQSLGRRDPSLQPTLPARVWAVIGTLTVLAVVSAYLPRRNEPRVNVAHAVPLGAAGFVGGQQLAGSELGAALLFDTAIPSGAVTTQLWAFPVVTFVLLAPYLAVGLPAYLATADLTDALHGTLAWWHRAGVVWTVGLPVVLLFVYVEPFATMAARESLPFLVVAFVVTVPMLLAFGIAALVTLRRLPTLLRIVGTRAPV